MAPSGSPKESAAPPSIPSLERASSKEGAGTTNEETHVDFTSNATFDRILELATHVFGVPASMVAFVNGDAQCVGLGEQETAAAFSFCRHASEKGEITVIEDASESERKTGGRSDHGNESICFRAAAPLRTPDGEAIGALSIFAPTPQSPSTDQLQQLENLASMVMNEVELCRQTDERRQAKQELRQLKQEYQNVFHHAQDALFSIDVNHEGPGAPEFTFLHLNQMHEESTGLSTEGVRGKTPQELLGERVAREVEANYRRCVETGEVIEYEEELPLPAGTRMWHTKLSPVIVEGRVEQIAGIARDITERKEAERALRDERDRFATLFHNLPTPVVHGAPEEGQVVIRDVNAAFEEVFGSDADQVRGEPIRDVIVPDDRQREAEAIRKQLLRGETVRREVRRKTPDGMRDFQLQVAVREDEDGSNDGYAIYTDLTTRKEQERTLRRLTDAVDAAVDGMAILDRTHECVYANQAHAEVYGYEDPDAFVGQTWDLCYDDEVLARIENKVLPAVRADGQWRGELTGRRKDGTSFPQELSLTQLPNGGLICVVTDISERKEHERELHRNERRFQAVLQDPEMLVGLLDVDGTLLEANETSLRYIDAGLEDVVGTPFWETPWWDDSIRSDIRHWVQRAAAGSYVEFEGDLSRPEGTPATVRGTIRPVRDEKGDVMSLIVSARDVTERAQIEEELREREARLRGLANSIPGVVFQFFAHPDGTYGNHFVSEHAETVLGIAPEPETFHERAVSCVPETHREALLDSIDEAVESAAPWNFEMPFEKPSGEQIWLRGISTPEQREDAIVFNGVLLDITERKKVEQELREREQWFRSIMQNLSDGIFRSTPDEGIMYANEALVRMVGYDDAERLHGTGLAALFVDSGQYEQFAETVDQQGSVDGVEVELKREDGTSFSALVSCTAVAGEGEAEVAYYDGAITEISERREAEARLRKAKNFYEQVLEQVPIDLAVFTPDARFEYLNPQSVSSEETREWLIGHTNEEYCRKRGFDPEIGRMRDEAIRRVARTNEPVELEETLETGDGPRYYLRVHGPVTALDGEVTNVAAFGLEITGQREYEQKLLEAKEEAEEAARLKTAMLANMSHEIRTPLTSIIGFSEVLCENLDEGLVDFAEKVHQSSQRLMKTLDSVLQLSKLEAEVSEMERESNCLAEMVRESVDMLRAEAEDDGITLQADLPTGRVDGQWSEGALIRIINNLLENALKFTQQGDRIEVRVQKTDTQAVLEVEDTGVGISEEFQAHVFEAFKQESEGIRRKYEGSGLGLSIVQKLAEAHGGEVDVESEKGRGTCFSVTLPRVPSKMTTASSDT